MRFLKQFFKKVVFESKKVSKHSSFGNDSIITDLIHNMKYC